MTLNDRIVLALSQIIEEGKHNITGYRIAKTLGVETTVIYRQLRLIKEGK